MYRIIFSFNELCNKAFGSILIPAVKLTVVIGFILNFFGSVRLYNQLDGVSLVLTIVLSITFFLFLVAISVVMSSLYDISKKFKPNIGYQVEKNRSDLFKKVFRKDLDSCQLVRCRVGSVYHMETGAKLTLVHSVLNGVACLLINVPL